MVQIEGYSISSVGQDGEGAWRDARDEISSFFKVTFFFAAAVFVRFQLVEFEQRGRGGDADSITAAPL